MKSTLCCNFLIFGIAFDNKIKHSEDFKSKNIKLKHNVGINVYNIKTNEITNHYKFKEHLQQNIRAIELSIGNAYLLVANSNYIFQYDVKVNYKKNEKQKQSKGHVLIDNKINGAITCIKSALKRRNFYAITEKGLIMEGLIDDEKIIQLRNVKVDWFKKDLGIDSTSSILIFSKDISKFLFNLSLKLRKSDRKREKQKKKDVILKALEDQDSVRLPLDWRSEVNVNFIIFKKIGKIETRLGKIE